MARDSEELPLDAWRQGRHPWAEADLGWDQETGIPGRPFMAGAVQVWAVLQPRESVTVAEAAAAFAVVPRRIMECCLNGGWMYLAGPEHNYTMEEHLDAAMEVPAEQLTIEHEGE